jgi:hypothetical protein
MPKTSSRTIRPPSRFSDEKFEETAPYDRCMSGYKFPALHKDHLYRQPKRDNLELEEEERLDYRIRGGRSLDCHGYLCDNFVAEDDEEEEQTLPDYTILDECEDSLSSDTESDDDSNDTKDDDADQDSSDDETDEEDADYEEEHDEDDEEEYGKDDDEDYEGETSSDYDTDDDEDDEDY